MNGFLLKIPGSKGWRANTLQRAPSAAGIHIDYAAELNPQQHAAVTAAPGPLLVIAGAKDRS